MHRFLRTGIVSERGQRVWIIEEEEQTEDSQYTMWEREDYPCDRIKVR